MAHETPNEVIARVQRADAALGRAKHLLMTAKSLEKDMFFTQATDTIETELGEVYTAVNTFMDAAETELSANPTYGITLHHRIIDGVEGFALGTTGGKGFVAPYDKYGVGVNLFDATSFVAGDTVDLINCEDPNNDAYGLVVDVTTTLPVLCFTAALSGIANTADTTATIIKRTDI